MGNNMQYACEDRRKGSQYQHRNLPDGIIGLLILPFVLLWKTPYGCIQAYRWINMRKLPQWKCARSVATACFLGINALWIIPVWIVSIDAHPLLKVCLGLSSLLSSMVILLIPLIGYRILVSETQEERKKTVRFWRESRKYFRERGIFLSIVRELGLLVYFQMYLINIILFGIPWLIITLLGLIGIFLPLSILLHASRGIFYVVTKRGYLLCLGTTLVTTGLAGWLMHEEFGDRAILWTTALCTGIISGFATEGVRRVFEKVLNKKAMRQWMSTSVETKMDPLLNLFERTYSQTFGYVLPKPLCIV
jgi:hypothetical protein